MSAIDWELLVDYLAIFFSWPVAAVFIAILMVRIFRGEIGQWLQHLAIRRGETEVYSRQPSSSLDDTDEKPSPVEDSDSGPRDDLSEPTDREPSKISAPIAGPSDEKVKIDEEIARLKFALERQMKQSKLWEFSYLNLFLIDYTKKVLVWLSNSGPTATGTYHSAWMKQIPSGNERNTVLGALTHHLLVEGKDGQISVTDKGKEYIDWANLPAMLTVPPPSPEMAGLRPKAF